MSKSSYWITDADGVYARVEGADQRDLATRLHGWSVADEPGPEDQVHVVHENSDLLPGRLPYGALQDEAWSGRGWTPGLPADLASALEVSTEQTAPAAEPVKPTKAAASAAGEQKEK